MSADVRIRWHLETVGDPSRNILRQDRQIRSSITATDRAQRKLAKTSTDTGRAQERGSRMATAALRGESRAASSTASDVARLNRAQAEALSSGGRLAASARRVADSYRTQARGADAATRAERARARAQEAGQRIAKTTAGSGAGLSRGVQGGLAAAAGGGVVAKAVSIFAGFEQQMDRVQAVSGATEKQMGSLTKQAKDLGANTSFSAREAADGMYQLSTAGFKTKEVMRTIPGVLDLAAASGVGLAEAAALQASAIRGFGLGAGDAGKVADTLAKAVNASAIEMSDLAETLPYVASTARQTGTSFEQVAAAAAILGNAGIKGSQAGTALRTSMLRLTDPSKKMIGVFKEMGIGQSELAAIPLPEAIGRVAEGLKKLPTRGQRVGAVAAIFGKEAAPAMLNLLAKGRSGIDDVTKALHNSEGTAKRTAKTMRDNVAGGWDQFTGSLETAAITLTTRFGPALADALKAAGTGVSDLAARGSEALGGIAEGVRGDRKPASSRGLVRTGGGAGGVEPAAAQEVSTAKRVGQAIGGVARTIGAAALGAGKQLLDAFKPALPFFQNVLLPLLKGVGQGILASVVGAFKVIVPVIRVFATALGWIGEKAKPLKPVFQFIGQAIGFVFGGPILRGIGLLGKLGGAFRIIGPAVKILLAPIRVLSGLVSLAGKAVGALASRLAGPARSAFGLVGKAAGAVAGVVRGAAGGIGRAASSIAGRVVGAFKGLGSSIAGMFRSGLGRGLDVIKGFGSLFLKAGKGLVSRLVAGVKGIGGAIVRAFAGGIGFAGDIGRAIANWLNDHTPLGDKVDLPSPLPDFRMPSLRRGGEVRRFQAGGSVPARVSPGELIEYGGASWTVPGSRTAADSVLTALPAGARVYTADGQARLAGGMDPEQALATQAPHFRAGGTVPPGRYVATSYGPPWTGINGTGVTASGVNLKGRPHLYGVAVDPSRIRLGSSMYAWPNPFGYSGRFRAFDTGSAIKGNRLDFYDWRGRDRQNGWGRRTVKVSNAPLSSRKGGPSYTSSNAAGAAPTVRYLRASSRRSGLLDDAFGQGVDAGTGGLSRAAIDRYGNPIIDALREEDRSSSAAAGQRSSRYSPSRSSSTRGSIRAGGGWGGSENIVRAAIRGLGRATFKRSASDPLSIANPGSDHSTANRGAFAADLPPGDSVFNRLRQRLHIPARKGSWNKFPNRPVKGYRTQLLWYAPDGSHRDHVHLGVRKLRRGGRIGGALAFAAGGGVPGLRAPGAGRGLTRGANRALSFAGGSLEALDSLIGQTVEGRLLALRRALLGRIRKGGAERVVKRLQGMLDTVDFELGRRVGKVLDRVAKRTAASGAATDRLSRFQRRRAASGGPGVDSASTIRESIAIADLSDIPAASQNVRDIQDAIARTKRVGGKGSRARLRELGDQLTAAQGELDEQLTTQMERRAALLEAVAQEQRDAAQGLVDAAQHVQDLAGLRGGALDASQRLAALGPKNPLAGAAQWTKGWLGFGGAARADSATGMRQRAAQIQGAVIPGLQGSRGALEGQLALARQQGDTAGIRAAELALSQNANDLANALADAGELLRDASLKVAQDVVDTATHRENLANAGLQRLELEQKIAGTFTTAAGGHARADYITNTIIPALKGEQTALQAQLKAAKDAGDEALARQIAEAIAANQNDQLAAIVSATEETAANTEPLKDFTGSLATEYGGTTTTDNLHDFGLGT